MANQNEGRGAGGQQSGGNFKNDPQRAAEAGRKGGEHSHGGQGSDQNRDKTADAGRKSGEQGGSGQR